LNRYHRSLRYSGARQHQSKAGLLGKLRRLLWIAILVFILLSVGIVMVLRYAPAPTSAFMLYQHVQDMAQGKGYIEIQQRWRDAANISKNAQLAVIASEDQLFYKHNGFDVDAITAAVKRYAQGGKLRGASTISQQVAKNLFLIPEKNFLRKTAEVWFTVLIEIFWTKPRILEMYLNIAEFGDHIYGIEAASRYYFNIPASQLSAAQAALLAASLPNPKLYKVDQPGPYLIKRQSWILAQMRNPGIGG
jgi:monofunctional glycosyltransferase